MNTSVPRYTARLGTWSYCPLPYYESVAAGFPSPADDYLEDSIDLNRHLIRNPDSTFLVRVEGMSMVDDGIEEGDVLIVDRSLTARHNRVVVACVDGEFTVKRLLYRGEQAVLQPANRHYSPIVITPEMDFLVWGVVIFRIKHYR